MRRTLKRRLLPLLCAGLLLCPSLTIAYATAGGTESPMPPTAETTPLPTETPPPETTPVVTPPVETPPAETPPVETPPAETPPVETPPPETTPVVTPPVETPPTEPKPPEKRPAPEPAALPSYSIEITPVKLEFSCAPVWNTTKHCYEGWKSTQTLITVNNTTPGGAAIQVTLTFTPLAGTDTTAEFALSESALAPEGFTVSPGKVTFQLPQGVNGTSQATFNLSLSGGDLKSLNTPSSPIGSIKTELTPITPAPNPALSPVTRPAEKPTEPALPPPTAPSQPEPLPAEPKPLPAEPKPLPAQPEQPPATEVQPPATVTPEQERMPDVMPPPGQNPKEETQTAPPIEPVASPQEEPQ